MFLKLRLVIVVVVAATALAASVVPPPASTSPYGLGAKPEPGAHR